MHNSFLGLPCRSMRLTRGILDYMCSIIPGIYSYTSEWGSFRKSRIGRLTAERIQEICQPSATPEQRSAPMNDRATVAVVSPNVDGVPIGGQLSNAVRYGIRRSRRA